MYMNSYLAHTRTSGGGGTKILVLGGFVLSRCCGRSIGVGEAGDLGLRGVAHLRMQRTFRRRDREEVGFNGAARLLQTQREFRRRGGREEGGLQYRWIQRRLGWDVLRISRYSEGYNEHKQHGLHLSLHS
jgi:hypothetical protein